jgi:hypothetical protein
MSPYHLIVIALVGVALDAASRQATGLRARLAIGRHGIGNVGPAVRAPAQELAREPTPGSTERHRPPLQPCTGELSSSQTARVCPMLVIVEVRAPALVDADAPSSTAKSARVIVFESIFVSPAGDVSPATSARPRLWLHACGLPPGRPPSQAMDARRLWQPLRIGISLVVRGAVQWDN